MSSSLLIMFYFAITSSYAAEQDSWNCTLPPVPKNGYIEVMRPEKSYVFLDAKEIKKYKSYHLKFGCLDGFDHLGPDTQTCFEDGRTEKANFECLHYSLVSAQSTDQKLNCTLPPWPENGWYKNYIINRNINYLNPRVRAYHLKLGCDWGYRGVGSDRMVCFEDGRKIDTDFQCIPYCVSDNNTVSCESHSRCVVRPEEPPINHEPYSVSGCGRTVGFSFRRRRVTGDPTVALYVSSGFNDYILHSPWHAAVFRKNTSPYEQICGATLVSTKVVISAAHCFWSVQDNKLLPASQFAVAAGKQYRAWNEARDYDAQKSDVADIIIPASFRNTKNLQDDIALLLLASPFTFAKNIRRVCLDFDAEFDKIQLQPSTLGQVFSWGVVSYIKAGKVDKVNILEMPAVDSKGCSQQSNADTCSASDKFYMNMPNGSALFSIAGGSGLFFPEPCSGSRVVLRGVVSGAARNYDNKATWAAFTHVLKHERFIKDALREIDEIPETLERCSK